MSNKLVKHQEPKEILTGNQKKILFWICFIILSIAFITVWINILLTSKAFNTQMEEMDEVQCKQQSELTEFFE